MNGFISISVVDPAILFLQAKKYFRFVLFQHTGNLSTSKPRSTIEVIAFMQMAIISFGLSGLFK